MKKPFLEWFREEQKSTPELNLGAIKTILYRSFCKGFDTAYPRGYRAGYNDRDKEEPEQLVMGDVPLNPTPEMIQAGMEHLLPVFLGNDQQTDPEALTERIWRVMWAAK